MTKSPCTLSLLHNQIDFTCVPFSDRGSRLLVFTTPERSSFYVKLAERLTSIEPGIEAYLQRPPFIHDLYLIDENGEPLDFELDSWPHVLFMKTRVGEFALTFGDSNTIAIGLPSDIVAGIRFSVSPQIWKVLQSGGEIKGVRNLAYTSNGDAVQNKITPEQSGYNIQFIVQSGADTAIILSIGQRLTPGMEVAAFSSLYRQAEQRWQEWFACVPPVNDRYLRAYAYAWWVMANNLIQPAGTISYEAMMPSKVNYVGLWLWDSAMHALAYRHINPEMARNQLRVMLMHQLPDGMLPDAIYDEGVISEIDHPLKARVTKPPILAWAALKLHEMAPDLAFLQEIYVPLVRLNAWWFSMNDDDVDGLVQYNHPYSSGLDDNPLWDYGMPVESPDLNTYLCVQMGSLALMAEFLGMENEGAMWRRRTKAIVQRMIDDFWDADAGIFRATHEGKFIPVITPFNLYPLWTGQMPDDIRARLLAHLTNPEEFWGTFPIPSVARNDSHYDPETMWRGPTWVNVNYFFIEALQQIGEYALACDLREKTLDMILAVPGMYEYYNAETGQAPPRAAEAFGWTAAVFIDLAIAATQEEEEDENEDKNHPKTDP
ncbi:MAG: amylo-alpha-1,6-glucosidase [Chloroflexota bacterium]